METKLQLVPDRHDTTTDVAPLGSDAATRLDGTGQISFVVPRRQRHRARTWKRLMEEERGAVTAEYAIVIMAAVAFAGLLVAILRSDEIRAMLVQLVENALGAAG